MKPLIVGGDAFLGKHLAARLGNAEVTSRRPGAKHYYYLGKSLPWHLPQSDVIYLVGGITKFKECEIDPQAYHINVDAQLEIASHHARAFIVYVSSETCEWPNQTAYGSHKRACELGLMAVCGGFQRLAIVRPGRITANDVDQLCDLLIDVGGARKQGIHRWTAPVTIFPRAVAA